MAPGDQADSLRALHDSLRLAEQNSLQHNQAWCHNYLGVIDFLHTYAETCRATGRDAESLALLDRTIELARELGRPHDEKLARAAREIVHAAC